MPELLVYLGMSKRGPFVQIAAFCENILEQKEESGSVMTAVRIVDTYTLEVPKGMPAHATPAIRVRGLIALKAGDVTGSHKVELVMENPVGERRSLSPEGGWPAVFKGGEIGFNAKLDFLLGVKNFGLCWFDVLFDGELLTRMPLRLRRIEATEPATEPSS
jgi:hypothetical protein